MASETVKATPRPRAPRPNVETGEGRTAAEWLDLAAQHVRAAAHAAGREPARATPQEVSARLGSMADLAAKLEPHLKRDAAALEAAVGRPGLSSSSPGADPRVVAGHAAWRVRDLAAGRYLSGLVHQLEAAHADVASLSEVPVAAGEGDTA